MDLLRTMMKSRWFWAAWLSAAGLADVKPAACGMKPDHAYASAAEIRAVAELVKRTRNLDGYSFHEPDEPGYQHVGVYKKVFNLNGASVRAKYEIRFQGIDNTETLYIYSDKGIFIDKNLDGCDGNCSKADYTALIRSILESAQE